MTEYNVKQIADLLSTNPETVRRWIRTGKLEAIQTSKKGGNLITEEALKAFLKATPKYAGIAGGVIAAAPMAAVGGLPLIMGAVVGSLVGSLYHQKNHKVSVEYIKLHLTAEIKKSDISIRQKRATIDQLKNEIESEQKRMEELRYVLEHTDLKQLADDINKKG